MVVARHASFSRCVAGLRKNGAVSTVIVSPHFLHAMTETGPNDAGGRRPQWQGSRRGTVSSFITLCSLELSSERLLLLIAFVREMLPAPPADGDRPGWAVTEAAPLLAAGLLAIVLEVNIGTGRGRVVCDAHLLKSKRVAGLLRSMAPRTAAGLTCHPPAVAADCLPLPMGH